MAPPLIFLSPRPSSSTPLGSYWSGKYVAVGNAGLFATSDDLISWVVTDVGLGNTNINSAAYDGTRLVLSTDDGRVQWAEQDVWQTQSLAGSSVRVSYAHDRFFALAPSSNAWSALSSGDPFSWSQVVSYGNVGPRSLSSVVYGNGFFALGTNDGVYWAANGQSWSYGYESRGTSDLIAGPDRVVAARDWGESKIYLPSTSYDSGSLGIIIPGPVRGGMGTYLVEDNLYIFGAHNGGSGSIVVSSNGGGSWVRPNTLLNTAPVGIMYDGGITYCMGSDGKVTKTSHPVSNPWSVHAQASLPTTLRRVIRC